MKNIIVVFLLAFVASGTSFSQKLSDLDNPLKDQQFLDDVIVVGSECVGQDCVNGENFGFDTGRYKENNLRVHFEDTSNSASFPSNDWRIVINDSSNGGANYFAIEDATAGNQPFRVSAGAGANALTVDSQGDVGIGTTNAVVELHVADGDSPTLRLEQNGSSGFTPQTWDLAGNETNFFVRDVTNGSKLPFRIRPGAPDNSIYIDTDGDIGMGTNAPDRTLHLKRTTGTVQFLMEAGGGGAIQMRMQTDNVNNRRFIGLNAAGQQQSQISLNDGGIIDFYGTATSVFSTITAGNTALTASSSRHLKSNISNFKVENILERISNVPVTTYNWKEEFVGKDVAKREVVGLIAQDFHTVLGKGMDTEINGQHVQMALWMGVQELTKENQAVKEELAEKELRISELESKLEALISLVKQSNTINTTLDGNSSKSLGQNNPNPFDKETQISYDIPADAIASSLQIVNMSGQVLKKVAINQNGKGVININTSDLPNGTYAYSLIVDGVVIDTKKMVRTVQ